jgi:hypothetical protein
MVLAFFDYYRIYLQTTFPRPPLWMWITSSVHWRSVLKPPTRNNAPVPTTQEAQQFLAKKVIQLLLHPLCFPDLALADYFLFPMLKTELMGLTLTLDKFKTKWEGGYQDSGPRHHRQGIQVADTMLQTVHSYQLSLVDITRKAIK